MASEATHILYACVSKGTTVLAELSSGDENVASLALQCLEHTPPFHRIYSHTSGNRIYSFLIEDLFVYFTIYDESLGKPQGLSFLHRVKHAFLKLLKNRGINISNDLTCNSIREDFAPMFRYLMQMQPSEGETPRTSPRNFLLTEDQIGSLDGSTTVENVNVSFTEAPLLGRPKKYEKISRSLSEEENGGPAGFPVDNKVDATIESDANREYGLPLQKNGCCGRIGRQNRARKVWRQHVRIVLLIDFVVCCVLFAIWLSICKGFHCISR
ncbi:phytolongin Phyl2.2-like [Aristolochia californica]|uniref:phytolongin Phyl2.2-like n=1 Tax=Aristolochia californica TaxID=171875 RepID=UPI0035E07AC1